MIVITGHDTLEIDDKKYNIVRGEAFSPAHPDFEPRVLNNTDPGTGGLLVEFGHNRWANTSGVVEQIFVRSCDRFVVLPVDDDAND